MTHVTPETDNAVHQPTTSRSSATILASVNRSNLRITLLGLNYSPEPTGNAPYTTSLAEGLAAMGHSVRVITGYPHYPEWKRRSGYTGWMRDEVIGGVNVKRLRHHIPRTPNLVQRLHMELSFGIRSALANWGRPDVVLFVSPALFATGLAMFRAKLTPKRPALCIWVQDFYSLGVTETGAGGHGLGQIMAKIESLIFRYADGIVAIHERFQHYMVSSLGVASGNTRVIRNWTHLPSAPTVGHGVVRKALGWADDDIVVLHAGNMGQKQGLHNVVEAARLATVRESRVRFVLMGDGNQRTNIEASAANVSRLDFVDPLPGDQFQGALAAADILLINELPGVKDMAVPSKLTSYFSAGVPVVAATDEGSVTASEIKSSGGGVRVDAGAPEKLLEAVEALASDPEKCQRLGVNGLHFRQVTLSEEIAISRYDEFLTSLASSRG